MNALWQMVSTVLWLIWVVTAVAAAMSSKRGILALEEAEASRQEDREAQMVGVPMQDDLPTGTVVGVATGASLQGDALNQPTFQGMPVAVADGVCQGMPVRDEAGNVSRPSSGVPKQV